jgi:hypothetical protein
MAETPIRIDNKRVLASNIAYVEHFDPADNPALTNAEEFLGRVHPTSKSERNFLTRLSPQEFEDDKMGGFRYLPTDKLAFNPAVVVRIEDYDPAAAKPEFQTTKPYTARVVWIDPRTNDERSKLLQTDPDTLAATLWGTNAKRPNPRGPGPSTASDPAPAG